jgi:hypothetical protein
MDIAMFAAWHTAVFGLNGYAGKLKGKKLSDFLGGDEKPEKHPALQNARAIHFFQSMKAKGFPVEITRVERKDLN